MIEIDGWRLEEPYWLGPNGERLKVIAGGYGSEAVAIAGIIATVAATAVGTYAAYEQGQQQEAAGKYNAKIARNQALAAEQAAAMRAQDVRERQRRIAAMNVTNAAAGGIIPSAGSPLLVMADNAMQSELEAQRVTYGGELTAAGERSRAELYRFGGQQAAQAGSVAAGETLLSGAARASRYLPRTSRSPLGPSPTDVYGY